jgi:hypothetical protein
VTNAAAPGGFGLNLALNVTLGTTTPVGSEVITGGTGNVAINLFGNGTVIGGHEAGAYGLFNSAVTLGGTNNGAAAGLVGPGPGVLNHAFVILGSNSRAIAGGGPLAIAGSILQTGAYITKAGPGFNINGFAVGGAAATQPPTAATGRHGTTPTAEAGTHSSARGVASAAAKRNAA